MSYPKTQALVAQGVSGAITIDSITGEHASIQEVRLKVARPLRSAHVDLLPVDKCRCFTPGALVLVFALALAAKSTTRHQIHESQGDKQTRPRALTIGRSNLHMVSLLTPRHKHRGRCRADRLGKACPAWASWASFPAGWAPPWMLCPYCLPMLRQRGGQAQHRSGRGSPNRLARWSQFATPSSPAAQPPPSQWMLQQATRSHACCKGGRSLPAVRRLRPPPGRACISVWSRAAPTPE